MLDSRYPTYLIRDKVTETIKDEDTEEFRGYIVTPFLVEPVVFLRSAVTFRNQCEVK
jgi:hypothetical protein